jgi:nucleoside 2-deoxyribosyltransferase
MAKVSSPTNYLAARENYQMTKYKLRRSEDELLKAFEVKTVADLEEAMLRERSKRFPRFNELSKLYSRQHQDFADAENVFEIATEIQRERIRQLESHDAIISTLDE